MLTAQQVLDGIKVQLEKQNLQNKKNKNKFYSSSDYLDFSSNDISTNQLILERPKVLYNAYSNKYVMWFHLDATHKPRRDSVMDSSTTNSDGDSRNSSSKGSGGDDGGDIVEDMEMGLAQQQRRNLRGRRLTSETILSPSVIVLDTDESDHIEMGRSSIGSSSSSGSSGISGGGGSGSSLNSLQRRQRYWLRRAGVATSSSPFGPFEFLHALKPDGLSSLDLQLFEEDYRVEEEDDEEEGDIAIQRRLNLSNQNTAREGTALLNSTHHHEVNTYQASLVELRHGQHRRLSNSDNKDDVSSKRKRRKRKRVLLETPRKQAFLIRSVDNAFLGISQLTRMC